MARLDIEKQKELEPQRMAFAKQEIEKKGYKVTEAISTRLTFEKDGSMIYFFPYSGWTSGRSIKDGRGLKNLLKQL